MTKQEELQVLRDALAKLGPNTYLGPWLRDSLPFLEQAIMSDIEPQTAGSVHRYQEQQKRIIDNNNAVETENAERRAKAIVDRAEREAQAIKNRLYDTINTCMKEVTK